MKDTVSENKMDNDRGEHSHRKKKRHSIKDAFLDITFAFLEPLKKAGCCRMPTSQNIQRGSHTIR